MKFNYIILVVFFVSVFSGCATAYKRNGFTGGYSETQLGENIFQVSFRGNGYSSRTRASDFALLRSAEIALENGFRYFIITDAEKYSKESTYKTPTRSHTTGSVSSYGNYSYGSAKTKTYGGQTYKFSKPTANNTIVCFKEKPNIEGAVFDANFIVSSIKGKYNIPY
ncbi:MAG: hypothetical protein L6420_03565 [Elusimicrobia bacterium]|nr:hypothetical protein [Elusimicrobiota bacterium]